MALVMMHYFPQGDFYKISYTAMEDVEDYAINQTKWVKLYPQLKWKREFTSTEEAKAFKKKKLTGVTKFKEKTLSSTDTFRSDNPPGKEGDSSEVVKVHWVYAFTFGDLTKVGYTGRGDPREMFKKLNPEFLWCYKTDSSAKAKEFAHFAMRGCRKVQVENEYFATACIPARDLRDTTQLKADFLARNDNDI
jgi:hypothetical protein